MPRYGLKNLFNGFEIRFMAFVVLFLERWKLFCVILSNSYLDRCENINSMALILVLRHSLFYF